MHNPQITLLSAADASTGSLPRAEWPRQKNNTINQDGGRGNPVTPTGECAKPPDNVAKQRGLAR